jgi:hypothetical protein
MIAGIVAIVAVVLIAIGVIATRKRQPVSTSNVATASASANSHVAPEHQTAAWTVAEGDEFSALSEAQRCDLIFAIQDLPGGERTNTLRAALDDPSEVVAFAAATALCARGERALVEGYFAERPGARSERIRNDLSLLTDSATASS